MSDNRLQLIGKLLHFPLLIYCKLYLPSRSYPQDAAELTASFNNMWSLNSKLNRQIRFSLTSIKFLAAPLRFRLLPSAVSVSLTIVLNDLITARSAVVGTELGGAAEHLIENSKKRVCGLSFEFLRVRMFKGSVRSRGPPSATFLFLPHFDVICDLFLSAACYRAVFN